MTLQSPALSVLFACCFLNSTIFDYTFKVILRALTLSLYSLLAKLILDNLIQLYRYNVYLYLHF